MWIVVNFIKIILNIFKNNIEFFGFILYIWLECKENGDGIKLFLESCNRDYLIEVFKSVFLVCSVNLLILLMIWIIFVNILIKCCLIIIYWV